MVLDPIPQSLCVHFWVSTPAPHLSCRVEDLVFRIWSSSLMEEEGAFVPEVPERFRSTQIQVHIATQINIDTHMCTDIHTCVHRRTHTCVHNHTPMCVHTVKVEEGRMSFRQKSCGSLFAGKLQNIGLFCRKWHIHIRHSAPLRHRVVNADYRQIEVRNVWIYAHIDIHTCKSKWIHACMNICRHRHTHMK